MFNEDPAIFTVFPNKQPRHFHRLVISEPAVKELECLGGYCGGYPPGTATCGNWCIEPLEQWEGNASSAEYVNTATPVFSVFLTHLWPLAGGAATDDFFIYIRENAGASHSQVNRTAGL